jgi:nondiscriminating aspartyl-tRNA synthetase
MTRTLIEDLHNFVDQEVTIAGWVDVRRDHGKLIFIDLRDRTGVVQMVALPNHAEAHALANTVRAEWVIQVVGKVNKRPEKMVNQDQACGDIEIEALSIRVLAEAQELPFEKDAEVNIDTLLDYRPLTLRSERERAVFEVQATIVQAYRNALIQRGFTEFQAPALVGGDAEGGSAVFKLKDYFGKEAYLATSPQLYKEIMVGPFERAFTIAKVFRAEKSATTRHLSEIVQMDFEMGFVNDHYDVMTVLESVVRDTAKAVSEKHAKALALFGTKPAALPEGKPFPTLTLKEAQETIEKEFGSKAIGEPDMTPEHERLICEWALKEHGSDFVFITEFPTAGRAFYTYDDPENPGTSKSFDLLFRGLEINSGSQRIHNYEMMVAKMQKVGLNPEKFSFYLQAFKYGMPPHGGCSTGLERFTARMLELPNVKEAVAFPRDMNRIDNLLSDS